MKMFIKNYFVVAIFLTVLFGFVKNELDYGYHSYDDISALLKKFNQDFPTKTHLYSIGKTVENRDLWVLAMADSQPDAHIPLRPEAKYIGNMHGNEVPSKEILLHLIDYMLNNQNTDPSVDYLMKNTRIHILPTMNPDGLQRSSVGDCGSINGRANANNYDLNRNFPDLFQCNTDRIQPETYSIVNWLENNQFVISANFHGGSVVANYPWDNDVNSAVKDNPTGDNDVFVSIAKNYSYNNLIMRNSPCEYFQDGITNGADWYPIRGGMQDFNYWVYGCAEITVEVSCCKYPPPSELNTIWLQNKKSLIEYLKLANTGVRGIVTFENGQVASYLTVKIDQREPFFKTGPLGEYYRILLPGTHKLSLALGCDEIYSTNIEITANKLLLELNITLSNDLYGKYVNYTLKSKYSLFCTASKQPASCSNHDFTTRLSNYAQSTNAYNGNNGNNEFGLLSGSTKPHYLSIELIFIWIAIFFLLL